MFPCCLSSFVFFTLPFFYFNHVRCRPCIWCHIGLHLINQDLCRLKDPMVHLIGQVFLRLAKPQIEIMNKRSVVTWHPSVLACTFTLYFVAQARACYFSFSLLQLRISLYFMSLNLVTHSQFSLCLTVLSNASRHLHIV